ncbi:hypothetical protein COY28_03830 [Candidatus Woesearchaeota archaeon CG_4_10_14_0_2_um_filter_57_5]|nr:MAG: hypothetical protein AUJ68_02090 [Candidatus Woesearchaeota archaeon CG1_02_57_44]PIZ53132.1 MAG: hypothetical protein COY28_03830 [Candidatus Woesearchaeota archaeon CG_4_10_14_0_2_um_filter_57_5]
MRPAARNIALLLVALVLLSSCGVRQGSESPRQVPRTGTQGIELSFHASPPPARVYATDPSALTLMLDVRNKGVEDVDPGSIDLRLSGYDPSIVSIAPSYGSGASGAGAVYQLRDTLLGKSEFMPEGGYELAQWATASILMPRDIDRLDQQFIATACYIYRTRASPTVCLDPDPYSALSLAQDKACQVRDISLSGGQGAPVAVTRVEEQIFPQTGEVQFKVVVSNVGGGTLFDQDSFTECANQQLSIGNLNKVVIEQAYISGLGSGTCNPEVITMNNGQGFTYCRFGNINGNAGAYETPLQLVLSYGYKTSTSKGVSILRTPGTY